MKLALVKASTNQTVYVFIQDSSVTTGAGLTGLTFETASLVCYYVRPGATAAALTLATQTVAGAHSDGGFVEVDSTNMPGLYRLDLSDAILATGVPSVVVMLKGAADMAPLLLEIQLTSADLNDATDLGLTNLDAAISSRSTLSAGAEMDLVDAPNATAVTAIQSGLATTVNVSAVETDTQDLQTQIGTAGAGLTALGDTRLAYLDAAISGLSTYDGTDTAGTTTLLARLTALRAGYLDELGPLNLPADVDTIAVDVAGLDGAAMRGTDGAYTGTPPTTAQIRTELATELALIDVAISSRSAYDGLDTSGVTTLLVRLSAARAGYLDELAAANLPADIAALPDAAAINAEVVDALATDTIAELTTDPGATPTHRQIAALLYMWLRNANTATATTRTIANNAGVDVFSAATSDDGTTFSQGKLGDA